MLVVWFGQMVCYAIANGTLRRIVVIAGYAVVNSLERWVTPTELITLIKHYFEA